MNPFFRFKSLRTRLAFWFLLVTMLCLVSAVTFLYFQRAEIIRARELEKLEIVRDLKVRELNSWLEERISDMQVIANDNDIRGLEGLISKTKDEWTAEDLKTVLLGKNMMKKYLGAYSAYHEVFFIEATSGRVFISTNPIREGDDKRDSPYFIEAMRARKIFIRDIFDSKTEGKPAMAFSVPVYCSVHDGEHMIGVLVARANLEVSLFALLQDRTGAGETGETLIVNRDGFAVNALRWHESAPLKLKINAAPAVRAVGGETGIVETEDYRGEMVLAAYTYIPIMGWGFVVKRDLAEVYAPIDVMLRQMVVLVLVSFLVLILVSFLLSGTIARPVVGISAIVRRFTEGDLEVRCTTEGVDEVATLGMLFNRMAGTLSSQMTIQQRTFELADTMGAANDMEEFASGLLMKLIDMSGSHLGAFYLRSEDGQRFEQVASVGLSGAAAQSFSAEDHEGELGQTLATGKVACLRDISPDTAFTLKMTGGTAVPREIMTIPLIFDRHVMAVVSLATLSAYSDTHRKIIDRAQIGMNTTLSNLMANLKTRILADELSGKNTELTAQTSELQAQSQEMEAQRDELQAQTKELEARGVQVQAANKLKSEFLSNMSHELRTPLNSIMSLSQLMISRGIDKDPAKAVEYLKVIDRNGRQLLSLINDILDLTKIESGRMDVFPTKFEAKQIIGRVLETVTPLAQKKNIQFETSIDQVPLLFSDEDKVYQILLNFCSNAIKFTEKGIVKIAVNATGGNVSFMVKDTGIGISTDDLGTIFDQFRQVDGSFTRAQEGTGLGLAISRKLAILLGGNITVESTPGTGSTFTLTMPTSISGARLPLETRAALPAQTAVSGHHSAALTVLVIDDEDDARTTLSTYLTEGGYQVLLAKSGKEGLEMAKALQPDVISLDLLMPTMDGWEVLRHLKSAPETVAIPIIITSVSKDKDTGWALGAAGYVPKPVDNQLLLEEIQRVSGKKPAKRLLIVDDDLGVQEFLKDFLGTKGFIVETTGNGKEALEMITTSPPHLLILDLLMPDVDGFSVLEQLRQNPKTLDLPVIILTSKDLTKDDLQRLSSAVKTISKDKLNKEVFLYQIETALKGRQERSTPDLPLTNQILVVEDNEIASEQIVTALQENGFDVAVARDGVEGLAHVKQSIPAGIVLDLMMPRVDGFQVLEQIRSRPETAKIPVLILTAKEINASERAHLTHNNIQQLIQKGTADRNQLVDSVKRLVGAHRNQLKKPAPKTIRSGAGTILLVEDNADNRLTITAILEQEDCELLIAENGEQGVQMAGEKMPDLILMDIQLPAMSGIDAIKILKKDPTTRAIPIIAVTARAMKGDRENILATGADDYISKPINPAELQEKVRKWVGVI
jgi:CheY-like chemotaxis protein/HAMP domain-containing protein